MRTKLKLLLALLVLTAWTTQVNGQSIPDDKKAAIVFDIRIGKFKESKLGKMGEDVQQMSAPVPIPGVSPESMQKLSRVFGQAASPTYDVLKNPKEDELPMDAFVRLVFEDVEATDEVFASMSQDAQEESKAGKKLFRFSNSMAPVNVLFHRVDDKTIEIGTEFYLTLDSRRLFTDQLGKTWGQMEDDAIRFAMDLDQGADIVKFLKEQADGAAGSMGMMGATLKGFAARMDNINAIRLGMDFSQKNLLTLVATGKDSSKAEDFREALDSILGLGKMTGKGQISQMKGMIPAELADVGNELLDSFEAKVDGTEVSFTLPRPKGFEEAIMKAGEMASQMGPPGMGPGGPPRGGPGGAGPPGGGPGGAGPPGAGQ